MVLLALLGRAASAQDEAPALPAPDAGTGAPLVARIELRSDVPVPSVEELFDLVTLAPGDPLDERQVRRSLRNLHASGIPAEAEAWIEETAPGSVGVTFALWGNVLVEEVRLLGEDFALRRENLLRDVEVKEGQPLVEDRVLRTVYRLQDRYRSEGYLDATVRARVAVDEARKRARVGFELAPGPRALVGEIELTGDLGPFAPEQLIAELRGRPGEPYRPGVVRDDPDRLRRWLHRQGHGEAAVELVEERLDAVQGRVHLAYRVATGGKHTLVVEGVDATPLRRQDLLPPIQEEGYDEAAVTQAVQRIRRFYQERGHYRVAVESREIELPGELRIVLRVDPGPLFTLAGVRFTGNEGIAEGRLRELMTTSERRLLVAGSGRLVDEVLQSDLENLRAYYHLSGWGEARVGPPEIREDGLELEVVVPIVEGPRTRVVELRLEGVRALPAARLIDELPLHAGGAFHPRLLEEAVDRVRARYELLGHPHAQVSASTDWNEDETLVDVTIRVVEGPQQVAGNLVVHGNQRTDAGVIRMLSGIRPDEPLSRRRLLEVQRSLYRLGIFSRVEVELAPAGDSLRERDVVVRVEEGRNRRVAYGFGYDSEEGIGGLLGYSHANVLGRAIHFQVDGRASERTQRFRLLLRQPYWGGAWPGSVTYLVYRDDELRPSFQVEQRGAQAELARGRGRVRYSLFGDYRDVDLGPGEEDFDISDLPLDEQRAFQDIKILSVIPRAVLDRRDDPIEPHRGTLSIAQIQYAFPVEGISEEHFLELFGQHVRYWEVPGGVVAASLRAGGIEAFDDRPVSVAERFFAGGRTTHRAYDRDMLGIPDETILDGTPVGGLGLLLLNLDYRFPIAGPIGGTVFADAGNVWPGWREIQGNEVKLGGGVGLRYLSPIGPLRVEMGWKLERDPGEPGSVLLVSFGNAF